MNMCNRRRLLRQKAGGACLYMPQDGHWKPVLKFSPPPHPPQKTSWLFYGQKVEISQGKTVVTNLNFRPKKRFFGEDVVPRTLFSTLANNKRSLPTNSTKPGRLRFAIGGLNSRWRFFCVSGQFFASMQHRQKKVVNTRIPDLLVRIYSQKKPIAGFSWPGGQYSRDKRSRWAHKKSFS